MDGSRDIHIQWNESKTNIIWYHLYVESKKKNTNELTYKTELTHKHRKQIYGLFPKEERWGETNEEFWIAGYINT